MDIIISANEKILAMARASNELTENMSEQEYLRWLWDKTENETGDKNEIQKITV